MSEKGPGVGVLAGEGAGSHRWCCLSESLPFYCTLCHAVWWLLPLLNALHSPTKSKQPLVLNHPSSPASSYSHGLFSCFLALLVGLCSPDVSRPFSPLHLCSHCSTSPCQGAVVLFGLGHNFLPSRPSQRATTRKPSLASPTSWVLRPEELCPNIPIVSVS